MNRKWLVTLLVLIALLIWGHNLIRVIEKSRSAGIEVIDESDPLAVSPDELTASRTLSFRYSNPFRKGPEPQKRSSSKKTAANQEKPPKAEIPALPPWKFLGFSDNAGVLQLSDGALIVVREGENVQDWTIERIDPAECWARHKDGHEYTFSLEDK